VQAGLGAEEVRGGTTGDAGAGADLLQAGAFITALGEEGFGRDENGFSGGVGVPAAGGW